LLVAFSSSMLNAKPFSEEPPETNPPIIVKPPPPFLGE
jgi:hypothetical protein